MQVNEKNSAKKGFIGNPTLSIGLKNTEPDKYF
jgi:hypothetical protein